LKNLKKFCLSNKKKIKFWSLIIIFFLVIIKLLYDNVDNVIKVSNINNWSAYYALFGAVIGGIFTIIAVYITLRYERKKEEETNRLQVLPYLNYKYIVCDDTKDYNEYLSLDIAAKYHDNEVSAEQYTRGLLVIKNIGLRSAVEVNILQIDFDNLKMYQYCEIDAIEVNNSGEVVISVIPPTIKELKKRSIQSMNIEILIGYSDLLDYYYEQTIELSLGWVIQQSINDENHIESEKYSFGCGINNVSRPIIYKDKHVKNEKFKRINEFNNHTN
jgi:hypothetical protein